LRREDLFSRLPEELTVAVLRPDFRGSYRCGLAGVEGSFLTLEGPRAGEKSFLLPLGSEVQLGFALAEGWVEFEGKVVGWSASSEGNRMMVSCPPLGRIYQRRHEPRLPGEIAVTCSSREFARQSGGTRNLSRSGMCVSFAAPLPEGRNLAFRLLREGAPPVRLRGEVVWQTAAGDSAGGCLAGVYAEAVSPAHKERLKGLLDRLRRDLRARVGVGD